MHSNKCLAVRNSHGNSIKAGQRRIQAIKLMIWRRFIKPPSGIFWYLPVQTFNFPHLVMNHDLELLHIIFAVSRAGEYCHWSFSTFSPLMISGWLIKSNLAPVNLTVLIFHAITEQHVPFSIGTHLPSAHTVIHQDSSPLFHCLSEHTQSQSPTSGMV